MDKLFQQLQAIKKEQQDLKQLKLAEQQYQKQFISNCKKLIGFHKQKKQDYVLENLIQINESVSGLANDILGFKAIRSRLFQHASNEKEGQNRLYLYVFHLFESLVNNISTLIQKSAHQVLLQCPPELLKTTQLHEISSFSIGKTEGFFAENLRALLKNKEQIQDFIDHISKDQRKNRKMLRKQQCEMEKFIEDLQKQQQNQAIDNSFEVRWSLQELENIVYEFVNGNKLPQEFLNEDQICNDVKKEDILNVQKFEKSDKDDILPQMVRQYILHDRGNSLFLSDSFANLPSPVNESQTIKQLFKPKEEDEMKKNQNQHNNLETKQNNEIKIEGKKSDEEDEGDNDKKPQVDIDVGDIDKIVFKDNTSQNQRQHSYYQDEDSYVNPSNISYGDDSFDHRKVDSIANIPSRENKDQIELPSRVNSSSIDQDTIKINFNDIYLADNASKEVVVSKVPSQNQNNSSVQRSNLFDSNSEFSIQNPYSNRNHVNQKRNLSIKILDSQIEQSSSFNHQIDISQEEDISIINQEESESIDPIKISHQQIYQINQDSSFKLPNQNESIGKINVSKQSQSIIQMDHPKNFYGPGVNNSFHSARQRVNHAQAQNIQRQLSNPLIEDDDQHSSCKNTIKITEQQEFSFFNEGKQSATRVNVSHLALNRSKQSQWNPNVQETVTRIQGLNSSRKSSQGKQIKQQNNPFKVDAQVIRSTPDISEQQIIQGFVNQIKNNSTRNQDKFHKSSDNQYPNSQQPKIKPAQVRKKSKDSVHSKKDSSHGNKRSVSPLEQRSVVPQDQQNMGRCTSLRDLEMMAQRKLPQNTGNSITNKHTSSTYDISQVDGQQTPSLGTKSQNFNYLSKDPSKRSISTLKSRPQQQQQQQTNTQNNQSSLSQNNNNQKQSSYLRVLEDKVEVAKKKNLDALKMVLGSYNSQESRNYISHPMNSQPNNHNNLSSFTRDEKRDFSNGPLHQQHKSPVTQREKDSSGKKKMKGLRQKMGVKANQSSSRHQSKESQQKLNKLYQNALPEIRNSAGGY